MNAFIRIKHENRVYQILALGLKPEEFEDAFRRCTMEFASTREGILAMKRLGQRSLGFAEAFEAIPQPLCVKYGFIPVREFTPEIELTHDGMEPVTKLSDAILDKDLIATACSMIAEGPYETYARLAEALRMPPCSMGTRSDKAWHLMRAVDAYGGKTLPATAYRIMADILYDRLDQDD